MLKSSRNSLHLTILCAYEPTELSSFNHSLCLRAHGTLFIQPFFVLKSSRNSLHLTILCAYEPTELSSFNHSFVFPAEGQLLPSSLRQRVYSNGSLELQAITRDLDQGSYSCSAHGRQGILDSEDLFLRVAGTPSLSPHTQLLLGLRVEDASNFLTQTSI